MASSCGHLIYRPGYNIDRSESSHDPYSSGYGMSYDGEPNEHRHDRRSEMMAEENPAVLAPRRKTNKGLLGGLLGQINVKLGNLIHLKL